jgi:hypothetical protein
MDEQMSIPFARRATSTARIRAGGAWYHPAFPTVIHPCMDSPH